MTGAGEVFVVQLARTSRRALRYLQSQGLESDDQDEVIAAAVAWCWEHREQYSLVTTLETWFVNAVKHAYERWIREELRNGAQMIETIPTEDTTQASAESFSAAQALLSALPREYRRVAWLDMQGYSRAQIMKRGIPQRVIDETRERIREMRRLVPDHGSYQIVFRTTPLPISDDACSDDESRDSGEVEEVAPYSKELGEWAHKQPERVVGGLSMFQPYTTHAAQVRKLLNKKSGLEENFMPTYVPPKHWRQ